MKYLGGSDTGVGPGDAAGLDAALIADGGAGAEDAATPDGSGPAGTGGDADPSGRSKPYCKGLAGATALTFCADFDDAADFGAGWSGKDMPPNGCTLSGTALYSVSAPRALSAKVTASGNDCSLYYTHAPIKGSVALEADVRLTDFIDKSSSIFPISLYQVPSYRAVSIQATGAGWNVIDVPAGAMMSKQLNNMNVGSTSPSRWHHVSVTINLSMIGGPPTVTATVDNNVIVKDAPLTAAFSAGDSWAIYAGLTANNAVTEDYIDNVAIYMK